jgi:hypothetical protein
MRRRTQCTAFQLITGHAFHATYSRRFRATAPDIRACPDPECEGADWTPTHYFDDGCLVHWEPKVTSSLTTHSPPCYVAKKEDIDLRGYCGGPGLSVSPFLFRVLTHREA